MANPQQPELARSRRNPALNPDATETRRQGETSPGTTGPGGPIPEDNLPGHHPERDQDKPDPADFVAKVQERARDTEPRDTEPRGTEPDSPPAASSDRPSAPVTATPATATAPRPEHPSERAERIAAVATAPLRAVEKVLGAVSRRL